MTENSLGITLTIKNYRSFSDEMPVKISIKEGFTSFVGTNNSGKSSLLRFFFEFRGLFAMLSRHEEFLQAIPNDRAFNASFSTKDNEEMFCNTNNRGISIEVATTSEVGSPSMKEISPDKILIEIPRATNTCRVYILHREKNLTADAFARTGLGLLAPPYIRFTDSTINMAAYYSAFQSFSKMVYIGPFRNAVNIGGSANYYDMAIGQQFISMWDQYKSGSSKTSATAAIKLTEDIKYVFGFTSLEINRSADGQSLNVIVNGKPYRLEELGSGLAQFIVILANIAIKQPSWLLIDEPELNLHPSLQMDFLTTLASYTSHGIMFSTHNIGLARSTAENIYSFRLDSKERSEVKDFDAMSDLSEFLGELSYSGYKDLGYAQVLLVEGPTEVKTVQQFLRKYQKDHKIVLLQLGGSSLINSHPETELQEIKRLANKTSALIDSERASSDAPLSHERQAFHDLCERAGINCHILERRAMENYMSDRAVKTIGKKYQALKPYAKLNDISPSWAKRDNWRIAREMQREEIEQTDLGRFLKSL